MTKSTDKARDSSRWDRMAPGKSVLTNPAAPQSLCKRMSAKRLAGACARHRRRILVEENTKPISIWAIASPTGLIDILDRDLRFRRHHQVTFGRRNPIAAQAASSLIMKRGGRVS